MTINALRKLEWVRAGSEIVGWKVESLLATEDRPAGAGTGTERWHLLVLKRAVSN